MLVDHRSLDFLYASEPRDFHTVRRFKLIEWLYPNRKKIMVSLMETMVATIDLPGSFMTAARVKEGELGTFIRHSLAVEL